MLIPDTEMSAEIENDAPGAGNILTTNFDTYTLILQLVRPMIPVKWNLVTHFHIGMHPEYSSSMEENLQSSRGCICGIRERRE